MFLQQSLLPSLLRHQVCLTGPLDPSYKKQYDDCNKEIMNSYEGWLKLWEDKKKRGTKSPVVGRSSTENRNKMQNIPFLRTLCLNSEAYKPLVKTGELVPKRKPDAGSTEQQPTEKKA